MSKEHYGRDSWGAGFMLFFVLAFAVTAAVSLGILGFLGWAIYELVQWVISK